MTEPATSIEPASAAVEIPRQAAPPAGHEAATAPAARPHWRSLLALALGALALIAVALYLYVPPLYEVSTDDAYIDAHVVSVGPKVAAYVTALHISDNSAFKAGDLLIQLDPRDFQVAVDSANADVKSAEATAANIDAQLQEQQAVIGQNEAAVEGDRSTLDFAQQELQRYNSLANTGVATVERLQQAQSDIGQRQAALRRDLAGLAAARAQVAVLDTQRKQAEAAIDRQRAALAQARLNLSYTKIYATEDGTVANKTVEVGNFVQPARKRHGEFRQSRAADSCQDRFRRSAGRAAVDFAGNVGRDQRLDRRSAPVVASVLTRCSWSASVPVKLNYFTTRIAPF
jgi:membrane fusion protein (multidrug efflux system)